jgi:hypothetical protein
MEPITLIFYATVCGLLSLIAPVLGGVLPRIAIGAVVGAGSALAMPNIMALLS